MEDRNIIQVTGDVLTSATLLEAVCELRRLVLKNAHRLPKPKYLADHLGACETCIIEQAVKAEDEKQEALQLDEPESVDEELGYRRHGRRGKAA